MYLDVSTVYWSIRIGTKRVRKINYINKKNEIEILNPNQYSYSDRLYYFELMVDILCTYYLNDVNSYYVAIGVKAPIISHTIIDVYEDYINYKKHTINNNSFKLYISHLQVFIELYGSLTLTKFQNKSYDEIIIDFISLCKTKQWAYPTIKAYKGVVTDYLTYINRNKAKYDLLQPIVNHISGYVPKDINRAKKRFKSFTIEDYRVIMTDIINSKNQMLHLFIELMFYTHARPHELMRLQLENIDIQKNKINLIAENNKTCSERSVELPTFLIHKIKLLSENINDKKYYLFGEKGRLCQSKIVGYTTLNNQLKKIIKKYNMNNNYSLYSFKHFTNVYKYDNNFSIQDLQKLNNHSSIKMTEIYLRDLQQRDTIVLNRDMVMPL